jgi:hypothetical protein
MSHKCCITLIYLIDLSVLTRLNQRERDGRVSSMHERDKKCMKHGGWNT